MTVADPAHLWRVQLALECKAFDRAGRLMPVPCAHPDPLPTGYAVRYADGSTEIAFAATAPEWFVQQVSRASVDEVVNRPESMIQRLRDGGDQVVVDHFHTYSFDDALPSVQPPAIVREGPEAYACILAGQRVAGASSSRSDDVAAELWIETDPDHRRRGYATKVARAWGAGVREAGKIAFYSHRHDNTASAALARRLGVRPLFEIIALDLAHS
ncbi:GNAT family N-acetyltransferase [Microlunatus speluncae]|uniref:GNAT family N-acetyltransferase n=1 Tax=Microlunatus speluncae TaxID=2594267 RepID=UPI0012666641|nr:GNAT family N-acetyltransferase [Microlunatus speluncae]